MNYRCPNLVPAGLLNGSHLSLAQFARSGLPTPHRLLVRSGPPGLRYTPTEARARSNSPVPYSFASPARWVRDRLAIAGRGS